MSWSDIRPYFKTHLDAEGLTEWTDAFNTNNIPEDILDGSYHIQFGEFTLESFNQSDYQNTVRVLVRIFKNAFVETQTGYDEVVSVGESVAIRIMRPTNRVNETFKQVVLDRMAISQLADSNDNSMVLEMEFTVYDNLNVRDC